MVRHHVDATRGDDPIPRDRHDGVDRAAPAVARTGGRRRSRAWRQMAAHPLRAVPDALSRRGGVWGRRLLRTVVGGRRMDRRLPYALPPLEPAVGMLVGEPPVSWRGTDLRH